VASLVCLFLKLFYDCFIIGVTVWKYLSVAVDYCVVYIVIVMFFVYCDFMRLVLYPTVL
jgi:hypothetical protein